jgi:hypothetical protein
MLVFDERKSSFSKPLIPPQVAQEAAVSSMIYDMDTMRAANTTVIHLSKDDISGCNRNTERAAVRPPLGNRSPRGHLLMMLAPDGKGEALRRVSPSCLSWIS